MILSPLPRFLLLLSPLGLLVLASCSSEPSSDPKPDPMETPEPEAGAFELRVDDTKVPVLTGSSAQVTVRVVRKGSFEGAVRIAARDLPEGATLAPATVEADEDEVTLELRAAADAPHSRTRCPRR